MEMRLANCYLCGCDNSVDVEGTVRDLPSIAIKKCVNCGLVFLENTDHIHEDFYKNSEMHGVQPIDMNEWLSECEADDLRRFKSLKPNICDRRVLDFGCGAGGFVQKASGIAAVVQGVEVENRVRDFWRGKLSIRNCLKKCEKQWDLITAFHVFEHLKDPRSTLIELAEYLSLKGKIVIEVPNANDALLNLYNCQEFRAFTYWSQHLYIFDSNTIALLVSQAGLKLDKIQFIQRYPVSNHLYWLSEGEPGGHEKWSMLNSSHLSKAYEKQLAAVGMTDTLSVEISC